MHMIHKVDERVAAIEADLTTRIDLPKLKTQREARCFKETR